MFSNTLSMMIMRSVLWATTATLETYAVNPCAGGNADNPVLRTINNIDCCACSDGNGGMTCSLYHTRTATTNDNDKTKDVCCDNVASAEKFNANCEAIECKLVAGTQLLASANGRACINDCSDGWGPILNANRRKCCWKIDDNTDGSQYNENCEIAVLPPSCPSPKKQSWDGLQCVESCSDAVGFPIENGDGTKCCARIQHATSPTYSNNCETSACSDGKKPSRDGRSCIDVACSLSLPFEGYKLSSCSCGGGYRNGAKESDTKLCMGPTETGGNPCYPYSEADNGCNNDWSLCETHDTLAFDSFWNNFIHPSYSAVTQSSIMNCADSRLRHLFTTALDAEMWVSSGAAEKTIWWKIEMFCGLEQRQRAARNDIQRILEFSRSEACSTYETTCPPTTDIPADKQDTCYSLLNDCMIFFIERACKVSMTNGDQESIEIEPFQWRVNTIIDLFLLSKSIAPAGLDKDPAAGLVNAASYSNQVQNTHLELKGVYDELSAAHQGISFLGLSRFYQTFGAESTQLPAAERAWRMLFNYLKATTRDSDITVAKLQSYLYQQIPSYHHRSFIDIFAKAIYELEAFQTFAGQHEETQFKTQVFPALTSTNLLGYLYLKGVSPTDVFPSTATTVLTAEEIRKAGSGTEDLLQAEYHLFSATTQVIVKSSSTFLPKLKQYFDLDANADGFVTMKELRASKPSLTTCLLARVPADDVVITPHIMDDMEKCEHFDSALDVLEQDEKLQVTELQKYVAETLCHGDPVSEDTAQQWLGASSVAMEIPQYLTDFTMPSSLVAQAFAVVDSDKNGLVSDTEVGADRWELFKKKESSSTRIEARRAGRNNDEGSSLGQVLEPHVLGATAIEYDGFDANSDGLLDGDELRSRVPCLDTIDTAGTTLTLAQYLAHGGVRPMEVFCGASSSGRTLWENIADKLPKYDEHGMWDGSTWVTDDDEKAWRKELLTEGQVENGFKYSVFRTITLKKYVPPAETEAPTEADTQATEEALPATETETSVVSEVGTDVRITTTGVAAVASPTAVTGTQRLGFLSEECDGELDPNPRWDVSPVQWAIGSSEWRYYTGGAVFAFALMLGVLVLHALTGCVYACCKKVSLPEAMHEVKVTYSLCSLLVIIAEPVGQLGTVAVTGKGAAVTDRVVGVVVMVVWLVIVVVFQYKVFCKANFSAVTLVKCDPEQRKQQCCLLRAVTPKSDWMLKDADDEVELMPYATAQADRRLWWQAKGLPLYIDYNTRFRFWITMEMSVAFLLGVCEALQPFLGCTISTIVMASLLLIHTAFTFVARPFLIVADKVMTFIISPTMTLCGFMKVAFVISENDALADTMENLILFLSVALLLRALLDAINFVRKLIKLFCKGARTLHVRDVPKDSTDGLLQLHPSQAASQTLQAQDTLAMILPSNDASPKASPVHNGDEAGGGVVHFPPTQADPAIALPSAEEAEDVPSPDRDNADDINHVTNWLDARALLTLNEDQRLTDGSVAGHPTTAPSVPVLPHQGDLNNTFQLPPAGETPSRSPPPVNDETFKFPGTGDNHETAGQLDYDHLI